MSLYQTCKSWQYNIEVELLNQMKIGGREDGVLESPGRHDPGDATASGLQREGERRHQGERVGVPHGPSSGEGKVSDGNIEASRVRERPESWNTAGRSRSRLANFIYFSVFR